MAVNYHGIKFQNIGPLWQCYYTFLLCHRQRIDGMHTGTSRVENSAQGSSCQLKFVHALHLQTSRLLLPCHNNVWFQV